MLFLERYAGSMDASHGIVLSTCYSVMAIDLLYTQQLSAGLSPPEINLIGVGVPLFVVGICGNWYHHYIMAHVRKETSNSELPSGGLFNHLVCPHYTFEILSFLGMLCVSQTLMALATFIFVLIYLTGRTYNTRKWYMSKSDDFPASRKLLIPKVF